MQEQSLTWYNPCGQILSASGWQSSILILFSFVSHCKNTPKLRRFNCPNVFSFFNGCNPPVLELAVTSHMLPHGQDTSAAQEMLSLHGGLECVPRFLWVGLLNIWDFFDTDLGSYL